MSELPVPGIGTIDHDYLERLAATRPDEDGPLFVVELTFGRDLVRDESDSTGTAAGQPADLLAEIGAEVVFDAAVEVQYLGRRPPVDRVRVVRYPTHRSAAGRWAGERSGEQPAPGDAGGATPIVLAAAPVELPVVPGRTGWESVPFPPTEEDGPFVLCHAIAWAEGELRDEMRHYEQAAAVTAAPHGVRLLAWMDVESTVVGDGRAFDQVRFNAFPSRRAFEAVATDPSRLDAQRAHREPAMRDTYALGLRPSLPIEHLASAAG